MVMELLIFMIIPHIKEVSKKVGLMAQANFIVVWGKWFRMDNGRGESF